MVKVAIAGGTGAVGRALAETISQNASHPAVILSRQELSNDTAMLPTVKVNYDDIEGLASVLDKHGIHTVICTFAISGNSLKTSQINLIKAAALASSTKRFIPTGYSIDYPRDGIEILPPLRDYFDCLDELEKTDLEWAVVLNGVFLDYFGGPQLKSYLPPNAFAIDMANNAAAIPGTGDEVVTFTYTFDVAAFLVAALDLEEWPRALHIFGDEMTFNQFVKLAEDIKGKTLIWCVNRAHADMCRIGEKFTINYDSAEKLKNFEITELPSHTSLYSRFPKPRFQWFQSIFERWTVEGRAHIPKEGSLNRIFNNIKPLGVRDMLNQCWKDGENLGRSNC